MDNITASEIAGLAVGVLLLSATLAAPKIDTFFSSSQRRFSFLLHFIFFICWVLSLYFIHFSFVS
jgi:hypothetical protein